MAIVPAKDYWEWPRKTLQEPDLFVRPVNWRPLQLTAKLRQRHHDFTSTSTQLPHTPNGKEDGPGPNCTKQFHKYCDYTTMHGIRYIAEEKRTICEKIFWILWCLAMTCTAIYMMAKIYVRWENSPVITSVSNTNYPVTNINFPAVTVCTVNKAVNEKMVIQACRYNMTLSQLRGIISTLVDPEARNNDNLQNNFAISPKLAIKYLRLVAPKCEDYLLTCRWNSASVRCTNLFRLMLTDTGYCCSFNAISQNYRKSDPKNDIEVMKQEAEFDYLQKAVWDYTDKYREKNGLPEEDLNTDSTTPNTTSTDSYTCARVYDDDLFPGICTYISKCRDNPRVCKLSPPLPTTSPIGSNLMDDFPVKAAGAGRSRGLVLMLDTLRCEAVPTDSFKGLRVLVHDPDEFPNVGERGMIVGPGMENQIAITGTDIVSNEILRNFAATRRGCYFSDEFPLKYYSEYSRSSCVVECETEFIYNECQCTPYYLPGNYTPCSVDKINTCVRKAVDVIQKKSKPVSFHGKQVGKMKFSFRSSQDTIKDKTCTEFCLPACKETSYDYVMSSAGFPNQVEPNKTKMLREAIANNRIQLNDINYVSASISVLRVFFQQSSVVQFQRDEMFAWEDFVSNLGGVMGLCLGFSILSIVELIYFFTIRLLIDMRRYKNQMKMSIPSTPAEKWRY